MHNDKIYIFKTKTFDALSFKHHVIEIKNDLIYLNLNLIDLNLNLIK